MGGRREADTPNDEGETKIGWPDTQSVATRRIRGEHGDPPVPDEVHAPTQPGSSAIPSVPATFLSNGRFDLGEELGGGGMGVVFRAFDRELSRDVAIKFLRPSRRMPEAQGLEFLRNEARAIARLNHPNVVHVYDFGVAEGQPYLVMELVAGEPLSVPIERGPLPFGETMQITDQLLEGLKHAHAANVVHRDLKPSNVLRVRGGRVVILDFGLAGFDGGDSRIMGTPPYMAPEQWLGQTQDERTDLWSLAVLLYEMLIGERPFLGNTLIELREAVLTLDLFNSRVSNARLPHEVLRVLRRALEKEPERRYRSASELQAALREAASGLVATPAMRLLPEQRQVTLLACKLEVIDTPLVDAMPVDTLDERDEGGGEQLRTWQNECARIAREHDGLMVSQVGLELLVCFGYPNTSGGAPLLALQAAAAIHAFTTELGRGPGGSMAVCAGVATGVAIVEQPRDAHGRGVPIIQGPPAQAATTLVRFARDGEVLISARTHELVCGWFASEPIVCPGGLQAFRLGAPLEVATRFDATASRELTPLHGRQAELELQANQWREAVAGRGGAFGLIGDAGMGKSRLVHALKQQVSAEGGTVMTAQCWPQRRRTPFHPLVSLFRRSMGLDGATSAEAQWQRLSKVLGAFSPALRDEVPLFAMLLSINGPSPSGSAEQLRARIIEKIAVLLAEMSENRPLLLVVEDVHWSDPSTLEALDAIFARARDHRLLVALTTRPELPARWTAEHGYHEHRLGALTPAGAAAMARDLATQLGAECLPVELINDLVDRTGGVPFYLEELLRFVLTADGPARASACRQIPATLRETLVAAFDRLSAEARLVAQVGSVLDRDFRSYLVERLLDEPAIDVDRALGELKEAGVLAGKTNGQGGQLFFRHALLQEAAYQSLIPAQRRTLHGRIADLLLSLRGSGIAVPPELLASHYHAAGRLTDALDHWEEAGNAAARQWALREAVDQLGHALALLEKIPCDPARERRELRLLLALGPPLMSVRGYAAAEVARTYSRAYELSLRAEGSPTELFSPLAGLWQVNMVSGNLTAARALSERLLSLASAAGDATLDLMARRALGTTSFLQGEIAAAIEHTRAGCALYDRATHGHLAAQHGNDPGVAHGMYLAWALWVHGAPSEARHVATQTLDLADALAHPMSIALANSYAAIVENLRCDFARAAKLAERGLEVGRAHQLELWTALAELQLGWARVGQGQLAEGIAGMERGIAGWGKTGARVGTTFFYVGLAEAQLRTGDLDGAARSLGIAEAMVAKNGEHFYEPELVRVAVRVAHRCGQAVEALLPRLRHALALAERQTAGSWALRLACDLVELTRGTDLAPDAPALLERAIAGIDAGEGTADMARAQALRLR